MVTSVDWLPKWVWLLENLLRPCPHNFWGLFLLLKNYHSYLSGSNYKDLLVSKKHAAL